MKLLPPFLLNILLSLAPVHFVLAYQVDSLSLTGPSEGQTYVIAFQVPEKIEKRIHNSNSKIEIEPSQLMINGASYAVKSLNTRGNNTLKYWRKSFSISLEEKTDLNGVEVRKMAANNLAMDRNYWRNRLSFQLMNHIEIFPLQNEFGEVVINNRSQGIYLVIQKPDDFAKNLGSQLLIRSNYNNEFEVDYSDGENWRELLRQFRKRESITRNLSGKPLLDSLNQILDMSQYFKWLAINYLLMNGDYTDEIYFYHHSEDNRFKLIPWDYDDVFAPNPHEGWQKRNITMNRKLLFSGEAPFDRLIDEDKFIYNEYLKVFSSILKLLTVAEIKNAFESTFKDLLPLYERSDVIAMSEFDQSGLTNLNLLKKDLQSHYAFLITRRKSLLLQIEEELAK